VTTMRKPPGSGRTRIRGNGWRKVSSISTDKFETISQAILLSLRRELEVRGKVMRHKAPVLYPLR
jgi:hypothetical protein